MSIDADLNAGLIDANEAKERRKKLERESQFFGSMDGASKFVRGDAIAGILILLINIIGGLAIGIGQHDLSFAQAGEIYVLLTIGDGLVAQIPSLPSRHHELQGRIRILLLLPEPEAALLRQRRNCRNASQVPVRRQRNEH